MRSSVPEYLYNGVCVCVRLNVCICARVEDVILNKALIVSQ